METKIVEKKIFEIRGERIMLDFDLAILFGVETKVLKQAVKRNMLRFPKDFLFKLTRKEFAGLRSQIVTSNRGGIRYLPFAFTEQGVAMLSGVLNSRRAIRMNITIMRAFTNMRRYALTHTEMANKITLLEKKYNRQFREVHQVLNLLWREKERESSTRKRLKIEFNG